jgi:hypothetical protein
MTKSDVIRHYTLFGSLLYTVRNRAAQNLANQTRVTTF